MDLERMLAKCRRDQWRADDLDWTLTPRPLSADDEIAVVQYFTNMAGIERLAGARSLFALQRELTGLGVVGSEVPATPEALERSVRRRAAALLSILGRWCAEERRPMFAVVFEDEDRRSIQAALRGAEQAASADSILRPDKPANVVNQPVFVSERCRVVARCELEIVVIEPGEKHKTVDGRGLPPFHLRGLDSLNVIKPL